MSKNSTCPPKAICCEVKERLVSAPPQGESRLTAKDPQAPLYGLSLAENYLVPRFGALVCLLLPGSIFSSRIAIRRRPSSTTSFFWSFVSTFHMPHPLTLLIADLSAFKPGSSLSLVVVGLLGRRQRYSEHTREENLHVE